MKKTESKNLLCVNNILYVTILLALILCTGLFAPHAKANGIFDPFNIWENHDSSPSQASQVSYNNYPNLVVSCSGSPSSVNTGDNVVWTSYVSGGNGSYSYSWSGSDGLNGYGVSANRSYSSSGNKNATVSVTSGNQTASAYCNNVYVNNYNYNNNNYNHNNYNYDNNDSNYYYQNPSYNYSYSNPLVVTCSPSISSANVEDTIKWRAYASGGNGSYFYSWSGTDIDTYSQNISIFPKSYSYAGTKAASVRVSSGAQTVTMNCGYTNIGNYSYNNYNTTYPYNYQTSYPSTGYVYNYNTTQTYGGNLDVNCSVSDTTATVGKTVTWTAIPTGGYSPYTYIWTGTDSLTGSSQSLSTVYPTAGVKTASVTIRSANGQTASKVCSNSVTLTSSFTYSAGTYYNTANSKNTTNNKPVAAVSTNSPTNSGSDIKDAVGNGMSASSLFALDHIPWGWVFILVTFVLLVIIAYLVAQKNKKV
ncbi:MAG: hypothetical protein NTV72_02660 [Candidatus Taylorbacteria bacterium]|nr:hypothetical protein [Candidatus Taylorbacteria bacterium]